MLVCLLRLNSGLGFEDVKKDVIIFYSGFIEMNSVWERIVVE